MSTPSRGSTRRRTARFAQFLTPSTANTGTDASESLEPRTDSTRASALSAAEADRKELEHRRAWYEELRDGVEEQMVRLGDDRGVASAAAPAQAIREVGRVLVEGGFASNAQKLGELLRDVVPSDDQKANPKEFNDTELWKLVEKYSKK